MKNTITIKETAEHIEINIKMQTLNSCVNAIKQYNPSFKAQDIVKLNKQFKSTLYSNITDFYDVLLYEAIENQTFGDAE